MRCRHCEKTVPSKGYCCEKAELEMLRAVVDEATRNLDAEVQATGMDLDMRPFEHVRDRLKSVRAA